ncbi:MAG: glutamate--tRNA ligase [Oligoflexales bacterium]|nr:glutamate--tRNA ligase [Oligoflexales bacterium]
MSDTQKVRVRVAPSPTGDPHVGTAYVTLFNYILAKQAGGELVLRIEDTDQSRARASSEQQIYESLSWLGLEWDEGPDKGGDYGPYRQSERKSIHLEHSEQLLKTGHAYRCFCTPERLAKLREQQRAEGKMLGYDGHCRSLSVEEVEQKMKEGVPSVVRLKVPKDRVTQFDDAIRGSIEIKNTQLDDQVLIKSDGFPTYHLANVVDDHLMKISHVIRAEEWISSTPKHVLLYKAFGWETPVFAHVPLLRNLDKSKISKRKNPVSLNYYKRKGILPEAMVNFLALMGWSYGDDQEVFSPEQMMEKFKLKDIHLGGPVFDVVKLKHINQQYMQKLDSKGFSHYLRDKVFTQDYLESLFPLFKDRLECFEQFVDRSSFFFNGGLDYEGLPLIPKSKDAKEMRTMIKGLIEELDDLYEWKADAIQNLLNTYREKIEWKPRDFFMPIRLMATGRKDSPPLAESLEVIGREMVRFRLRDVLNGAHLKP